MLIGKNVIRLNLATVTAMLEDRLNAGNYSDEKIKVTTLNVVANNLDIEWFDCHVEPKKVVDE